MTYPCDKCENTRCTKACVSWIEWYRKKVDADTQNVWDGGAEMRQRGFREAKEFDVAGFGDRLRALREASGLSQTRLGKKVGISRGSLCFYETGERMPTIDIACKLASFFGVSVTYLCGEKGNTGYERVDRAIREKADMMQAFREIQNLLGNVEKEMATAKEIAEQNGED